jgi:DNA-directed RNA polymerase specialized sigma24 family protein
VTFRSTRWSVVARAGRDGTEARDAIAWLFEAYGYPLFAYARRRGLSHEEAEDAVHELFAHCLESKSLAQADPARGRFRSYMLGALEHRLSNRKRFWNALKRGGGRSAVSLDGDDAERRYALEPAGGDDPRKLYEAAWARTVIDRAFARVREDYAGRGEGALFERLKSRLVDEGEPGRIAELAAELGKSEEALKVALHRLRKRFRAALEGEIAETVDGPAEIEDELRHLFDALGG